MEERGGDTVHTFPSVVLKADSGVTAAFVRSMPDLARGCE